LNRSNPSNPGDQGSDEPLVARARAGDGEAFEALVLKYKDRVFSMCARMLGNRTDADDVTQEVFVTLFRNIERFEERARFSTWLYRITMTRCWDELRRRKTVKHTRPQSLDADEGPGEPAGREVGPEEGARLKELEALVERSVAELPEDAREVLLLRDNQELSYEEIAEIVEIPVGTVRSRLNRARKLLMEKLGPALETGA
jgi:RNA polymerase sigma-70 factor (ECF subfamily)